MIMIFHRIVYIIWGIFVLFWVISAMQNSSHGEPRESIFSRLLYLSLLEIAISLIVFDPAIDGPCYGAFCLKGLHSCYWPCNTHFMLRFCGLCAIPFRTILERSHCSCGGPPIGSDQPLAFRQESYLFRRTRRCDWDCNRHRRNRRSISLPFRARRLAVED